MSAVTRFRSEVTDRSLSASPRICECAGKKWGSISEIGCPTPSSGDGGSRARVLRGPRWRTGHAGVSVPTESAAVSAGPIRSDRRDAEFSARGLLGESEDGGQKRENMVAVHHKLETASRTSVKMFVELPIDVAVLASVEVLFHVALKPLAGRSIRGRADGHTLTLSFCTRL